MIEPRLTLPGVEVYIGDALETVRKLATKYPHKVSSVITSPAYLWKRAYLPDGHPLKAKEMGQEATPEQFVNALCDLFDAIREYLLREDASIWVNLADTWSGSGGAGGDYNEGGLRAGQAKWKPGKSKIPRKSLMAIPERFLIAMIDRGWICRNKPIWFKGRDADDQIDNEETVALTSNGMPISAGDKLKETYENWYHFVRSNKPVRWIHQRTGRVVLKKPRQEYEETPDGKQRLLWVGEDYFYDLDSVRVQHSAVSVARSQRGRDTPYDPGFPGNPQSLANPGGMEKALHPLGRNPGDLFFVPISPFPLAHFACYNPKVTEIPAKTTCPEAVCRKCGTPRQVVYWIESKPAKGRDQRKVLVPGNREQQSGNYWERPNVTPIGYTDCGCNAGWTGGIVLDPFFGSGSTAQGVNEARPPVTIEGDYCQPLTIGIDLDERNLDIIEKRLTGRAKQSRKVDLKPYQGGLLGMLENQAE